MASLVARAWHDLCTCSVEAVVQSGMYDVSVLLDAALTDAYIARSLTMRILHACGMIGAPSAPSVHIEHVHIKQPCITVLHDTTSAVETDTVPCMMHSQEHEGINQLSGIRNTHFDMERDLRSFDFRCWKRYRHTQHKEG